MQPTKTIEALLEELRNGSLEVHQTIVRQLRDFKDEKSFFFLMKKANDFDMDVRTVVIESLGNFKDLRAEKTLLQALHDEEWEIKWAALRALGVLWNEQDLRKMGDKLLEKRIAGIEVIMNKKSSHFFEPLVASLDDEDEVQSVAIEALVSFGDRQAISPLKKLQRHANKELKAQIEEALIKLGDAETILHQREHEYILSCDECGQSLPYSFLTRIANRHHDVKFLCQFHFEEYQEKQEAFQGKLKQCKVSKIYWPKIDLVEGISPPMRRKRYVSLPPAPEGQFRCFHNHKLKYNKDLSPISTETEPLCHRAAYQLAKQSANTPYLTQYAIQLLKDAFDKGLLLCERTRIFHPLDQIEYGEDFRDECFSYDIKK